MERKRAVTSKKLKINVFNKLRDQTFYIFFIDTRTYSITLPHITRSIYPLMQIKAYVVVGMLPM